MHFVHCSALGVYPGAFLSPTILNRFKPGGNDETAVIAITLQGELDAINALTVKLGNLPGITVKTAVSGGLKGENHV